MPKRLKGVPNLPFPPIVAGIYGVVAGTLLYATPQWLFEHMVDLSGIAQLIPAAQPPLGENARIMAAGGSVLGVSAFLWPVFAFVQKLIRKSRKKPVVHQRARGIVIADSMADDLPAPLELEAALPSGEQFARAPLFAEEELGAPLMSHAALEAADELMLDQPLDGAPLSQTATIAPIVAEHEPTQFFEPNHTAAIAAPTPAQWVQPAPQDYPTPPIYASMDPSSQFRLPDPVVAPVVPLAIVSTDEPVHLGFSTPTAVAEPVTAFDPFADSQSWNIAEISSPTAEAAPEMSFSAGFDPLAIDLPVQGEAAIDESIALPVDHAVTGAHSEDIDPFNFSFGEPDAAPAVQNGPASVTKSPDPFEPPAETSSRIDNSVGGLMSRLNQAMGSKVRPAMQGESSPPTHLSLGQDSLRAV